MRSDKAQERSEAFAPAISALGACAGSGDETGFNKALQQFIEIARSFDASAFADVGTENQLDSSGLPPALTGWPECGPGWYSLVVDTHKQLISLLPGYRILQIKQKYGDFCYYWEPFSLRDLYKHLDPEPDYPVSEPETSIDQVDELTDDQLVSALSISLAPPEETPEQARARKVWLDDLEDWHTRFDNWSEQATGKAIDDQLGRRSKKAVDIVRAAELQAQKTCEICGSTGHRTGGYWIEILCKKHAQEKGTPFAEEYLSIPAGDLDGQTYEQALVLIERIETADPDHERQLLNIEFSGPISDYGREQPKREPTDHFLAPVIGYVHRRWCQLAADWEVRADSAIMFGNITDTAQERISKLLRSSGVRDLHLERQR